MGDENKYPPGSTVEKTCEIADSETEPTNGVNSAGLRLIGISPETGFDGTAVGFKIKVGSTFRTVHPGGADYSVTVAVGKYTPVTIAHFVGASEIKPVAGTAQTGTGELTLIYRVI